MSNNARIFIKSIGTIIIELLLFIPLLIFSVLFIEYSENSLPIIKLLFATLPLGTYALYLLFSNTKFISLSCYLLKYRLKADNYIIIRVLICNIIFYGLVGLYLWLQADNTKGFLINTIKVLLLVEFGSCFFPKIKTRMTLFLLRIRWENVYPSEQCNAGMTGIKSEEKR